MPSSLTIGWLGESFVPTKVTRFIDGIAPPQDDSQTTQQRQFAADLGQGKRTSAKSSTADQFATAVEGFLR